MKNIFPFAFVVSLMALGAVPASAGIIYDNGSGGLGFDFEAYNIGSGCCNQNSVSYNYSVADSFSLAANGAATGVNFWAQMPNTNYPGVTTDDSLVSVDWEIVANNGTGPNSPFDGTVIASGNGTSVTDTFVQANALYNVDEISFSTGSVALTGGTTYWLILGGAVDTDGYAPNGSPGLAVYWDQSDGPSAAYQFESVSDTNQALAGYICPNTNPTCTGSEDFQITGTGGVASTPEPGTLALLGGGLLLTGLVRRRVVR